MLRNDPFEFDGTPMPTLYWLLPGPLHQAVSRIENLGGVRRAEAEVGLDRIDEAHRRYEAERCASVAVSRTPRTPDGPIPTGGVGGTRRGLKCLHAHVAWELAGGDDPVGAWVLQQIAGLTS